MAQKRSEGSRKLKKAQQKLRRRFSESLREEMPDTPAKIHHEMEENIWRCSDAPHEEDRYFHWESADRRCIMEEHLLPVDDFLAKLSYETSRLTRHPYTSNHQSKYFDSLKSNLPKPTTKQSCSAIFFGELHASHAGSCSELPYE